MGEIGLSGQNLFLEKPVETERNDSRVIKNKGIEARIIFDNSVEVKRRHERICSVLTLGASEVADVYLLSVFADWRNSLLAGEIGDKSPKKWAEERHHMDEAVLVADTYHRADFLAKKHVLSAIAHVAMIFSGPEGSNWKSLSLIVDQARKHGDVEKVYQSIPISEIINSLKKASVDDHAYPSVVSALEDLSATIERTKDNWNYLDLCRSMTLLHSAVHHIQATELKNLMTPGEKDFSYELLLRFESADNDFGIYSAQKFSSYEGKLLAGKWRHISPDEIRLPEKGYEPTEEQWIIAKELLRELKLIVEGYESLDDKDEKSSLATRANTFLDDGVKTMRKRFPLFGNLAKFYETSTLRPAGPPNREFYFYVDVLQSAVSYQRDDVVDLINRVVLDRPIDRQRLAVIRETRVFPKLSREAKKALVETAIGMIDANRGDEGWATDFLKPNIGEIKKSGLLGPELVTKVLEGV